MVSFKQLLSFPLHVPFLQSTGAAVVERVLGDVVGLVLFSVASCVLLEAFVDTDDGDAVLPVDVVIDDNTVVAVAFVL